MRSYDDKRKCDGESWYLHMMYVISCNDLATSCRL